MTDLDRRVGRLAPTVSPDPDGFAAAHATVLAAVHAAPGDLPEASPAAPDLRDLVEHVDVVVPLSAAARRRRRVVASLATAATTAAVVGGIALWPRPDRFDPAAAADRCAQWVVQHGIDDTIPVDGLRPLFALRESGLEHVLVAGERSGGSSSVWECTFDGTAEHPGPQGYGATGFGTDADRPAPGPGEIEWVGAGANGAGHDGFLWGFADAEVDAVTVHLSGGRTLPARLADGYWAAWYQGTAADPMTTATVTWRLRDGTQRGPERLADTRVQPDAAARAAD